jgi:hypothetical protein
MLLRFETPCVSTDEIQEQTDCQLFAQVHSRSALDNDTRRTSRNQPVSLSYTQSPSQLDNLWGGPT